MEYQINVFDYDALEPTDPTDPKDNGKSDGSKPKIESSEESTVDGPKDELKGESNKLPKTATSYYTVLFSGLLLVFLGSVSYFIVRRKRIR